MQEKFSFLLVIHIVIFSLFLQGICYSQWNNILPFQPSIGYEISFVSIPAIAPRSSDFFYQANSQFPLIGPYSQGFPTDVFPLSYQFPLPNPYSLNSPLPISSNFFINNNFKPIGNFSYSPVGNAFFINNSYRPTVLPNNSYNSNPLLPNTPYPFYLPYNFYPTNWFLAGETEESDDDGDNEEDNVEDDEEDDEEKSYSDAEPINIEGIWIGTWTITLDNDNQTWSDSASFNLAQQEKSLSGVFLFVGNDVINNLSATGVIEKERMAMVGYFGEGETQRMVTFKGEVNGNTLMGEFLIKNGSGAIIQIGEFILTRI